MTSQAAKELGARGGKARWKKISKKERSKIMKEVRKGSATIFVERPPSII